MTVLAQALSLVSGLGLNRFGRLRFEPAEEARFVLDGKAARQRHFLISGVFSLVVFNLFLLSDWMMVPDRFDLALRLRLLVYTPVALFCLLVFWRFGDFVQKLPAAFAEWLVMLGGVFAALCLVGVLLVTDSPYVGMYRGGLLPILVFGTLVMRFRFHLAVVFCTSLIVLHLITLFGAQGTPSPYPELELPMFLLILVVAFYTLAMNFRTEMEERLRFQRKVRSAALRRELEVSQARLEILSRQDALTGVPNRRRFDEVAWQCWQRHMQTGEQLAVMLLDVDHFKAFNDHHGHPAGDQCLRLVAKALQGTLADGDGTLARWGGEEFIVLLPHTDEVVAHRVADRLVQSVRALQLRHEASPTRDVVTISAGVALCRPSMDGRDLSAMVALADRALYQAKHEGRDRLVMDRAPKAG